MVLWTVDADERVPVSEPPVFPVRRESRRGGYNFQPLVGGVVFVVGQQEIQGLQCADVGIGYADFRQRAKLRFRKIKQLMNYVSGILKQALLRVRRHLLLQLAKMQRQFRVGLAISGLEASGRLLAPGRIGEEHFGDACDAGSFRQLFCDAQGWSPGTGASRFI